MVMNELTLDGTVVLTLFILGEGRGVVFHLQNSKWLRTSKQNKPFPW